MKPDRMTPTALAWPDAHPAGEPSDGPAHGVQSKGGLVARPGAPLKGVVVAPGDKSISHRALILGALASGVTEIEGLLEGDDVRRTAGAMRALGARVERLAEGRWRVEGAGGLSEPADVIDCGNAGTGARLIIGAAAGFPLRATFTGDASLRGRPMGRVLKPLALMGAAWLGRAGERLPLTLRGGGLKGIAYTLPEPSAQVKSAVLLAGLRAEGETRVIEPAHTRDHTERMLRAFGAEVSVSDRPEGRVIALRGGQALTGVPVAVPGDPSSAAFPIVAALITPGSAVTVRGVLLNPLRCGLIETLREMGADLEIRNRRDSGGDIVGDITARHSRLTGVTVPPERAASMIDEYPILAIAAAHAAGPTVMRGLGELRVKESDRIALMAQGLAACGIQVEEEAEGLIVVGTRAANHAVPGGAAVRTHGDHRIAMSFLVLGLAADAPIGVDEAGMIATSFPGFTRLMADLGARIDAA
jgi:3-phosphoshikimate 1-carboxyvinyltransferase